MLVFKCYLTASTRSLSSQGEVTNVLEKLPVSSEAPRGQVLVPSAVMDSSPGQRGGRLRSRGGIPHRLGTPSSQCLSLGYLVLLLSQTHQHANDAFLMQREHG